MTRNMWGPAACCCSCTLAQTPAAAPCSGGHHLPWEEHELVGGHWPVLPPLLNYTNQTLHPCLTQRALKMFPYCTIEEILDMLKQFTDQCVP